MSNLQPGSSGANNVPRRDFEWEEWARSDFGSDSDELFMDSDEDDDMLLARQLSLLMINSKNYEADEENSNATVMESRGVDDKRKSMCEICTDESDDMISYGCTHRYCRDCIKTTLETAINDGHTDSFNCPEANCAVNASENFIKMVVSPKVFLRYETFQIKKAVGDMDDVVYCPLEGCDAIIETDGSGSAECSKCHRLFCTLCLKLYHGNTDCELTEEERTDDCRRNRDEELAEKILLQESQDELLIEQIERANEEWLRRMREEQEEIRRMEQIVEEQENRRLEEERRREEAERQLEAQRKRDEEFQRLVKENEEREARQARQAREARQKQEETKQAEKASEETILRTTKKCPNCKSPIEKKEGCNAMMCTNCGYKFCWGCLRPEHGHNWVCNGNR